MLKKVLGLSLLCICIFPTALSVGDDTTFVVSKAVTILGDDLLKAIHEAAKTKENVLISPLNVYSALALIYLGADGETREELHNILGIPDGENEISVHKAVSDTINQLEADKSGYKSPSFTKTAIAMGLFMQEDFKIKQSYRKNSSRLYRMTPVRVDFARKSGEATRTVNEIIESRTNGLIKTFYKNEIDSSTSVLLVCALYFSGKWKEPFRTYNNRPGNFTTENGERIINVTMMNNVKYLPHITNSRRQYEAIRIPYEKEEYEMIIVLPTGEQTLKELVAQLDYNDYHELFNDNGTAGLKHGVNYKIPKMKFSWSRSIREAVAGKVKTLFDNANLLNLVDANNLHVSDITHATAIDVNEDGTEASAITAIQFVPYMGETVPTAPIIFTVDKPFLMMIYNRPYSALLFYGCVYNPLSSVQ